MGDRNCKSGFFSYNAVAMIVIAIVMFFGVFSVDSANAAILKPKCTYNKNFKVVWKWNKQPKQKIKGKKVTAKYQVQIVNVSGGKKKVVKTIKKGTKLSHSYKVTPNKKSIIKVRTYYDYKYKGKKRIKYGSWKCGKTVTHKKITPSFVKCELDGAYLDVQTKVAVPSAKYNYKVQYGIYINGAKKVSKTVFKGKLTTINLDDYLKSNAKVKVVVSKIVTNTPTRKNKYGYNSGWYKKISKTLNYKRKSISGNNKPKPGATYNPVNVSASIAEKNPNYMGYYYENDYDYPKYDDINDINRFYFRFDKNLKNQEADKYNFQAYDITPQRDKNYWTNITKLAKTGKPKYNIKRIVVKDFGVRVETDPYVSDVILVGYPIKGGDAIFIKKHGWNYGPGNSKFNTISPANPEKGKVMENAFYNLRQKIYNDAINNYDLANVKCDHPDVTKFTKIMIHYQKILINTVSNDKYIWFPGEGSDYYRELIGNGGMSCVDWCEMFKIIAKDFKYTARTYEQWSTSPINGHWYPVVTINGKDYGFDVMVDSGYGLRDKGYVGVNSPRENYYWMKNNPTYHPIRKYIVPNNNDFNEYLTNNQY